jgi:hypothetical protein
MRIFVALLAVTFVACANTSGAAVAADATTCEPKEPATDPATGKPTFGGGNPGAQCKTAADCAGLCCTCSTKATEKFLASECVNDKCADNATACADEEHLLSSQGFGATICP